MVTKFVDTLELLAREASELSHVRVQLRFQIYTVRAKNSFRTVLKVRYKYD